MIEVPSCITETVRDAARSHIGNIEGAIRAATAAVRELEGFEDIVPTLVDLAVQELVYRARTANNAAISNEIMRPAYTGPAKVNVGGSAAVNRVALSVYNHAIGGARLGDLTGADLERIAETETEIARGHAFNAALCRWCASKGVKPDQRVRDVIQRGDLERAFRRLKAKADNRAAKAA